MVPLSLHVSLRYPTTVQTPHQLNHTLERMDIPFSVAGFNAQDKPTYTTPHPLIIQLNGNGAPFKGFLASVYSSRTGTRIGSISFNDTTNMQHLCNNLAVTHLNSS